MQDITVNGSEPEAAREIVSTRVFAYPASQVFGALTDAKLLATWWGPSGFTNTFQEFDPQPGGRWRFVMHGPDGADYPNESQFLEVVAPRRIVFRHLCAPHFRMTITLADEAGGTRMTWRMLFATIREYEQVRGYAPDANEQNFDRLESVLATLPRPRKRRR
jgi:uncharacterized protein YndB with AHSA1/START domain